MDLLTNKMTQRMIWFQ